LQGTVSSITVDRIHPKPAFPPRLLFGVFTPMGPASAADETRHERDRYAADHYLILSKPVRA
jgi:hypothetical protein